ncbi:MAG: carboxypeptidase regulatory-like domain-containing protein [Bacteroidetes bacterium]|nr:carboxypeptidase regulatory-like domain-containing protein [Bacteroidota bacterium]
MKNFTKLFALLFAFTIISSMSLNAAHYTDPNGDGGEPFLEIWIYGATVPGGATLEAGDEIAVFSGDVLVGLLTLTVTPSTTTVWSSRLIAYSKNTSGDNLYSPGDAFTLKCWDVSAGTEFVAYGWGDGEPIDFHNEWWAPTSETAATSSNLTQGAFFPGVGGYSYCYVNATFEAGPIPTNVVLDVTVMDNTGTPLNSSLYTIDVTAGGYTDDGDAGDIGTYRLLLYAGDFVVDGTDTYTYTVEIDATGYADETFEKAVTNGNGGGADPGAGYTADVYLNATADVTGNVTAYNLTSSSYVVVENATVTTTIDGVIYSDNTDASGNFVIEDVPDGTWIFDVSYSEHITQEISLTILYTDVTKPLLPNPVVLEYKRGTIEGEIFDATTINLLTEDVTIELWNSDRTTKLSGTNASLYPVDPFTVTDGDYDLFSAAGGTYDIKVITTTAPGDPTYEILWIDDHIFYPDATETLNFNVLPTAALTPYFNPEITGNPNQMWSIHIEMAKFGDNFLIPWDELVIFDVDQVGVGVEPGLRVGTLRFQDIAVWQNSGSNVLKAFAEFSGGGTGFVLGNDIEFWAYDISHTTAYGAPVNWWFTPGMGTWTGTTFPDPTGNHISYLNIYWEGVPGELNGLVDDGTNPLDDVLVEVLNVFTQVVVASTTTAGGGLYAIENLDEGTYDVRFTLEGYEVLLMEDQEIVENEVNTLDVSLVDRVTYERNYSFADQGFYFIGRDNYFVPGEPKDMLTILDNNVGPSGEVFSVDYKGSTITNDVPVILEWDPLANLGAGAWMNNLLVPTAVFNWELLEGYQLHFEGENSGGVPYKFQIDEFAVDPEFTPIEFPSAGIYYIPYFPGHLTDFDYAIDAFASIFGELDWVMDSEGNRLHHDNGGAWVDNIGLMSPLEGYKIKMNGAATLTYPAYVVKSHGRSVTVEPEYFVYTGGNAANWTYTIYIDTDEFEIGDEIAAFSNGVMVGSMVIDSEDPWKNDLNTFYEAVNGGYGVNVPIELVAYDASEQIDYSVTFEMVDINSACYPGTTFPAGLHQFSYAKVYRGIVGVDENQIDNHVKVYPNPTNGTLNVESVSNINELRIYNVYGALVAVTNVNAKQQSMDVSNYTPGTYLVQLHTDTGVITKRVVVR